MTAAVRLIMGGLDRVHAQSPPALVVVAVLGQGHTLLLLDGEMTTLLHHGVGSLTAQNHLCAIQKNMKTSGDPILLPAMMVTNVMVIMVMRRGRHRLTVMDLHARGRPGHLLDRLQDPAPGLLTLLPPAVTDKPFPPSAVAASSSLPPSSCSSIIRPCLFE